MEGCCSLHWVSWSSTVQQAPTLSVGKTLGFFIFLFLGQRLMDCPCLPLCCRPALLAWTVKQMYPTPGLYFHMDTVAWIGRCFRVYMKELFAPKWAACTLCSSSSELAHADHALKPSEILPVYLKGKTHFPCIRVKGCQSHSISQRTHKH